MIEHDRMVFMTMAEHEPETVIVCKRCQTGKHGWAIKKSGEWLCMCCLEELPYFNVQDAIQHNLAIVNERG